MTTARSSVDVRASPDPADALRWIREGEPAGAVFLAVTQAKPPGLTVTPLADAHERLQAAADDALAVGALRVLVWHAAGDVGVGEPVVVVAAAGEHRKDAAAAVQRLLARLKGVAERRDLSPPGSLQL